MADTRVTSLIVEAMVADDPDTRLTSLIVEAAVADNPDIRVTSLIVEAMVADPVTIAGEVGATSTVTGTLTQPHEADGNASAVSTATATPEQIHALTGETDAVSSATGIVSASGFTNELVGSVQAVSRTTGELNPLKSDISVVSDIAAALKQIHNLGGAASTVSVADGEKLNATLLVSALGEAIIELAYLGTGTDELRGTPTGEAIVTGTLASLGVPPYLPVNYPLGLTDDNVVNLHADLREVLRTPRAEVRGSLSVAFVASTTGDVDTTGALVNPHIKWTGSSIGDAVVIGELFVTGIAELAGTSTGDANVYKIGDLDFEFDDPFVLYMYGNTTVGFDPSDTIGDADSQAFTDGDIVRDFARHHYQYVNINVGFDYTDDVSGDPGFVSQSYPDGDIIRDFARNLYQYLNVIVPEAGPECRLTVGPAPRSPKDLAPVPRPPRQRNR